MNVPITAMMLDEGPLRALRSVCAGLVDATSVALHCRAVDSSSIPDPYGRLLAHCDHMTETLRAYHGGDLSLHVCSERHDEPYYQRVITLSKVDQPKIVEFGIVRLDLSLLPKDVRVDVLRHKAPLGDILMQHVETRRVEPRWMLCFPNSCPLFRAYEPRMSGEAFGRLATIHCDGQAAIELLEVVPGPQGSKAEHPNVHGRASQC
jgi:chorismate-pyruvate lyase